ncbi:MAG: hypothetical protein IJP93_09115 [Bacteroidales bacterium]|nr:hypothetical protein [Bacteroidales bacterium]MBR0084230.1 hypothetical protein [Bacteroidales bacterium]MBR0291731.1 hypothetical protein [Bacteroidales bacterium]
MTRQEIKEWADATVKRIFHGHSATKEGRTETFKGQVVEVSTSEKYIVVLCSFRPRHGDIKYRLPALHPERFHVGDIVHINFD